MWKGKSTAPPPTAHCNSKVPPIICPSPMNLGRLLKGLFHEIFGRLLIEMDGDRKLPRFHVDAGRRRLEEADIGGEIFDSQRRRHDDKL